VRDDTDGDDEFRMREVLWPIRLDLVWFLLPAMLAGMAFGLMPLRSWDYWWHISFGRLFDQWGAIPAANHVLYTMPPDAPSVVQPWFAQWFLFQLHRDLGLEAVLILRNMIAAGVFLTVCWVAIRRSRSPMMGAVATAAMALGVSHGVVEARTYLLVWPIFAGLVALGYSIREGRMPWWLVPIWPAVTVLWANLHGSFVMPAVIAGGFAAAAAGDGFLERDPDWKRKVGLWGLTALASLLATYGNPRGFDIYGYLYSVATNPTIQATVSEWQATTLTNPPVLGPIVIVSMLVAVGLMVFRRDRIDPIDVVFLLGFGFIALKEARGILWWVVIWPIIVAPYLRELAPTDDEEPAFSVVGLVAALLLVAGAIIAQPFHVLHADWVIALEPIPVRAEDPYRGRVPAETPVGPAQIMSSWGYVPRMFHDLRYSGYLMYELDRDGEPDQAFFVDARIELPPEEIWELFDMTTTGNIWRGIFKQYGVRAVVLDAEKQASLADQIAADPMWTDVYQDAHVVLFVRDQPYDAY
jgi:hypothetical protein